MKNQIGNEHLELTHFETFKIELSAIMKRIEDYCGKFLQGIFPGIARHVEKVTRNA